MFSRSNALIESTNISFVFHNYHNYFMASIVIFQISTLSILLCLFLFTDVQPGFFWGKGGFWKQGHFQYVSCMACKRRIPQGKVLVFLFQDTLKNSF